MNIRNLVSWLMVPAAASVAAARGDDMTEPRLHSVDPPELLPDGSEFRTWRPTLVFSKTYYVDANSVAASDENPGTEERPFRTINRAAQVLQPGERVVVASGVYRERVCPARGGTGPGKMISYQAAPGAEVAIRGSRIVTEGWEPVIGMADVWKLRLPATYFGHGYNPFAIPNVTPEQFDGMRWAHRWRGHKPYTLPRGLVFQDDRRLRQVGTKAALNKRTGTYFVAPDGPTLLVRCFDGANPNDATMEVTVQQAVFAPLQIGLGFIHLKGFTIEHCGNPFPFPQIGALSTTRGHHWLIEENTVRQVNGTGIDVGRQYWALPQPTPLPGWHIVRRNTVTDCGVCGIQGLNCADTLIEDNLVVGNAFHPVEQYFETGGIKTHRNDGTLIRRNRIFDTWHGSGIWMDFANVNSRCTQNIIVNSRNIHGAIFLEASRKPNIIDRNIVWDTKGAAIYEHDCWGQTICHNLIGNATGPGLWLRGKVTDRKIDGEPITNGDHTVVNNMVVNVAEPVRTSHKQASVAGNITDGVEAELDRERLTLTWHAVAATEGVELPDVTRIVTRDFLDRVWTGNRPSGPFADVPGVETTVDLMKDVHCPGDTSAEPPRGRSSTEMPLYP